MCEGGWGCLTHNKILCNFSKPFICLKGLENLNELVISIKNKVKIERNITKINGRRSNNLLDYVDDQSNKMR